LPDALADKDGKGAWCYHVVAICGWGDKLQH